MVYKTAVEVLTRFPEERFYNYGKSLPVSGISFLSLLKEIQEEQTNQSIFSSTKPSDSSSLSPPNK
jgi:hypothetical protein